MLTPLGLAGTHPLSVKISEALPGVVGATRLSATTLLQGGADPKSIVAFRNICYLCSYKTQGNINNSFSTMVLRGVIEIAQRPLTLLNASELEA